MFTRPQLEAFLLWELADALIHKEGKFEKIITKRVLKKEVFCIFKNLVINLKELKKIDYIVSIQEKDTLAEKCASIIDAQFLHFEGGKFFDTSGYETKPKVQESRKPNILLFSLTKTEAEINASNLLGDLLTINFKGLLVLISKDKEPGLIKAATLLDTIQLQGGYTDEKLAKLRAKLVV